MGVPFDLHRYIIGQKGSGIRKMMDEFEVPRFAVFPLEPLLDGSPPECLWQFGPLVVRCAFFLLLPWSSRPPRVSVWAGPTLQRVPSVSM